MGAPSSKSRGEAEETLYFQVLPAGAYYATFSSEAEGDACTASAAAQRRYFRALHAHIDAEAHRAG